MSYSFLSSYPTACIVNIVSNISTSPGCPEAKYKFFITATPEERANRRYKEMIEKGISVNYNDILNQIKERDLNDINRKSSPLKKAEDAIEIDTTNMTKKKFWITC